MGVGRAPAHTFLPLKMTAKCHWSHSVQPLSRKSVSLIYNACVELTECRVSSVNLQPGVPAAIA